MQLNRKMHMLFEVQDLSVASPATVSRCGMVWLPPENLGWQAYVDSWIARELFPASDVVNQRFTRELSQYLHSLFVASIDPALGIPPS